MFIIYALLSTDKRDIIFYKNKKSEVESVKNFFVFYLSYIS